MTRSLDSWSGGIMQTEQSILTAYSELIQNAEHYIYIEVIEIYRQNKAEYLNKANLNLLKNQFFVTTTDPNRDNEVKNTIGLELVNRIKRAHQ
jgi:hypothetical protein